jgi:predicted RecA/RadA family phage recombinase
MKNFIQSGNSITIQAPQDVLSGQAIFAGDVFGVASNSVKAGEDVELSLVGVFDLPKVVGELKSYVKLYWDPSLLPIGAVTADGKDKKLIGVSTEAAQANQPTVNVRLNGVFPPANG